MALSAGEVEPGRESCDEESLADGAPREQACVFFANLPFRIDEVLAGSLPEQYRATVSLEFQADPARQVALVGAVPTDERFVLFIRVGSYWRRAGIPDVYYIVGYGDETFRDVNGRVAPLGLTGSRSSPGSRGCRSNSSSTSSGTYPSSISNLRADPADPRAGRAGAAGFVPDGLADHGHRSLDRALASAFAKSVGGPSCSRASSG